MAPPSSGDALPKATSQIYGGETGGISAGSMIACCSHFLLSAIPFIGLSGIAAFLSAYQKWFLVLGIISNIVGISVMIRHRNRMKKMMHNSGGGR